MCIIIGASGRVGSQLIHHLTKSGITAISVARDDDTRIILNNYREAVEANHIRRVMLLSCVGAHVGQPDRYDTGRDRRAGGPGVPR